MKKVYQIFGNLLEAKISLASWVSVFLSIILLRVFEEQFIARSQMLSTYQLAIEYIHNLYFFLLAFLLIWLFLSVYLKIRIHRLSFIMAWASLLILLPPLFDMIKTKGAVFWSFYVIGSLANLGKQFLTVFGDFPSGIVYFGTKITFIIAISFVAVLVFLKTKNLLKTLIGAFLTYVILFFMGSFPTLFVFAYEFVFGHKKISQISGFDVASFFGSPQNILGIKSLDFMYAFPYKVELFYFPLLVFLLAILFFLAEKKKFFAVIGNLRYPQLAYHAGLLFLGMGLGYLNFRENFEFNIFSLVAAANLVLSIWLAWTASVFANDIYDLEIDKISNPLRPLPKEIFSASEYAHLGIVFFLLSLLGGVTVGFNFFVLLLAYQIIAWFYSAPPYRLKKFPIVATFVSSLASLMVLFLGYILMSSDQTIYALSWRIILLLIICYTIAIPIKDFKDIEGDKKYGIWTIPVIFGEKNGRLIVAISHFCSYILSVFFLNELKLFFWALVFGVISYAIVLSKKIDPRRIFWWVLLAVSGYILVMIKIVFVDNLGKFNF
jgi:chlorophyll/bacteriochlorophyll a synthase